MARSRRQNDNGRQNERKKEALVRQEEAAKRSPEQRLNELDRLLGKDVGAKRERKVLSSIVTKEKLMEKFGSKKNEENKDEKSSSQKKNKDKKKKS